MELNQSLKKHNVTRMEPFSLTLQCNVCGCKWSPVLLSDGRRLSPRYWQCPNQCNTRI